MAITDQKPRKTYAVGATPQAIFAVPFPFFSPSDLRVYVGGALKTQGTHYSVSGGNGSTGTVTLTAAVSNTKVSIVRRIPIDRLTDFPAAGAFKVPQLNRELDRNTAIAQQLDDDNARAIRPPDDEEGVGTLPPLSERAGQVMGFDVNGKLVAANTSVEALDALTLQALQAGLVSDVIQPFVSDGVQTVIPTTVPLMSQAQVTLLVGGVLQPPNSGAYTVTKTPGGGTITLAEPAPAGVTVGGYIGFAKEVTGEVPLANVVGLSDQLAGKLATNGDASQAVVTATGGTTARTLADISADVAKVAPDAGGRLPALSGHNLVGTPRTINHIINGDFVVWLEGASFSNPASGTHVASIWRVLYDGAAGTFTAGLDGGPFAVGAPNGLRWNQTVAGSGGAYRILEQRIEDGSTLNGGDGCLSFYAGAGSAGTPVKIEVVQFFGTGGSPSSDVVVYSETISLGAALAFYEKPMTFPATSGKTYGTNMNDCVKVRFYLPATSTFDFSLRSVRLERGNKASPWVHTPYEQIFASLSRFIQYSRVSLGSVASTASHYLYGNIPYKSEMRAVPAVTFAGSTRANLLSGTPGTTAVNRYGASWYIASNAAGAFYAIDEIVTLDARL